MLSRLWLRRTQSDLLPPLLGRFPTLPRLRSTQLKTKMAALLFGCQNRGNRGLREVYLQREIKKQLMDTKSCSRFQQYLKSQVLVTHHKTLHLEMSQTPVGLFFYREDSFSTQHEVHIPLCCNQRDWRGRNFKGDKGTQN